MKRIIFVERWREDKLVESSGLSDKAIATFDRYGHCTDLNWRNDIYTQSTDECKQWDVRDAQEVISFLNRVGTDHPESRISYAY